MQLLHKSVSQLERAAASVGKGVHAGCSTQARIQLLHELQAVVLQGEAACQQASQQAARQQGQQCAAAHAFCGLRLNRTTTSAEAAGSPSRSVLTDAQRLASSPARAAAPAPPPAAALLNRQQRSSSHVHVARPTHRSEGHSACTAQQQLRSCGCEAAAGIPQTTVPAAAAERHSSPPARGTQASVARSPPALPSSPPPSWPRASRQQDMQASSSGSSAQRRAHEARRPYHWQVPRGGLDANTANTAMEPCEG